MDWILGRFNRDLSSNNYEPPPMLESLIAISHINPYHASMNISKAFLLNPLMLMQFRDFLILSSFFPHLSGEGC